MRKISICSFAGALCITAVALLFSGCSLILGFDNPVDPKSPDYQGYPVFDDPDLFRAEYPLYDAGELYFLDHFACAKILGADLYRLQVAEDESFTGPSIDVPDAAVPLFEGVDSPLQEAGDVFIRYSFRLENAWSEWTDPVQVYLASAMIDEPTGSINDTSPLVEWSAVPGAASYDLDTGSQVLRVTDSEYQWPEDLVFGTTLSLRVRAVNAEGLVGPWSETAEAVVQVDVTGRWDLDFDWYSDNTWGDTVLRFYKDGTFKSTEDDGDEDFGTFVVSGNRIDWYYDDTGTHYTGTFENEDEMAGTMVSGSNPDKTGRWDAERKTTLF